MRRLLRRLLRLLVTLAALLVLMSAGLDYYFTHVYKIRDKLIPAVNQRVRLHHVHYVPYQKIPTDFRNAIIATEDRRFWWDPGIDPIGIMRSVIVDVQKDGYVQGGSTITQQLVDNSLIHRKKTLLRKLIQALDAIGIYDSSTKQEVFAWYTNVIYFGHGAYGLYNAAQTYFGRTPGKLNAGELTMLAGLPNAPSVYDPFHAYTLARQRQRIVLDNMVDDGILSAKDADRIFQEPIRLLQQPNASSLHG